MDLYINWPTVTVIVVVAGLISPARQVVRLAIWSTRIILGSRRLIGQLESAKSREEPARNSAGV